jgi:hypothetical protein
MHRSKKNILSNYARLAKCVLSLNFTWIRINIILQYYNITIPTLSLSFPMVSTSTPSIKWESCIQIQRPRPSLPINLYHIVGSHVVIRGTRDWLAAPMPYSKFQTQK